MKKAEEIKSFKIDPSHLTWFIHGVSFNKNTTEYAVKTFGPVPSRAAAETLKVVHDNQGKYTEVIVNQNPNPPGF